MFIVAGLDIAILRQIIGFIYLSFIPGLVLIRILKLKRVNTTDTILLSIGLSIAFLMFIGSLMNELYPSIGFSSPLSTSSLIVTMGTVTLTMSIISYSKDNNSSSSYTISKKLVSQASLVTCVAVLAVSGAWLANNYILLLMTASIVVITVLLTILSTKSIHNEVYSIAVLVIAISLLLQRSLISKHLLGHDIFSEYYIFKLTESNSLWNAGIPFNSMLLSNYNAMLSITILPTIYSRFLNLQGEWIFKIIYPLICSFVPLTLYRTWRQQTGKLPAFLSAFIFMFAWKFLTISEMRQIIGELFFALLIYLMVNREIDPQKRRILFIIFGAALVVSHYSLSYIFLFCISFAWLFVSLMKKKNIKVDSRTINGYLILLFFVFSFSWYTLLSTAPIDILINFINTIRNFFFTDFFSLEARGMGVYSFTHPLSSPSFLHRTGNVLPKILYLWLLIGIIGLLRLRAKCKEMKFEWENALIVIANIAILSMVIFFPCFGPGFVVERFVHISLFFLAPLYVLGSSIFFKWAQKSFFFFRKSRPLPKNKQLFLVCIVLVTIFLFKVGFVYEVTGDIPVSIPLSMERMKISNNGEIKATFYDEYTPEQDVFSAIWLSRTTGEKSKIYADDIARGHVLIAYGMILRERIYLLYNDTKIESGACIYLRYINTENRMIRVANWKMGNEESLNLTKSLPLLNNTNKIYSNGYSEIYQS